MTRVRFWALVKHWVPILSAVVSVVAAWFSAISEHNAEHLKTELEAAGSLADWSSKLSSSGVPCADLLSQFSTAQFRDFANKASKRLEENQRPFIESCVVDYARAEDFGPSRTDLTLTEKERAYIARQVTSQLNAYDLLAIKWSKLGPDSKKEICEQAKIALNSPLRTFRERAMGTTWWHYPELEKFMDTCKD